MTRFSIVGAIGIVVQLAVLTLLRGIGVDYLAATALSVEAAILHNFAWHERYTWADRAGPTWARLARFHLANGAVSLVGNVLVMRWLVGHLHLPVLPANLVAITACWLLNFALSDGLVFTKDSAISTQHSGMEGHVDFNG